MIADIHFNHRLAVACAEEGADALRINPGTSEANTLTVLRARANGISVPDRRERRIHGEDLCTGTGSDGEGAGRQRGPLGAVLRRRASGR